jgi:hypothetical protein
MRASVVTYIVFFSGFLLPLEARSQAPVTNSNATLSGRILDSSGTPHVGFVRVFQSAIRDGYAEMYPTCNTSAAADGTFECKNLQSSQVIVQVWLEPNKPLATPSHSTNPPRKIATSAYYPGVTDLEAATKITLKPGDKRWIDIRVPDSRGAIVTGTILGLPSQTDFRLKGQSESFELDSGIRVSYEAKSGKFVANAVPDGHYLMTATWMQDTVLHEAKAAFVVKGANIDSLTLKDEHFVQVQGTITSVGESAVTHISLYRCDDSRQKVTSTISNGVFAFPPVPPGDYYLGLPTHQDEYVGTIQANGKEYADQKFPVVGGQIVEKIVVEVKRPGAVLQGALKDWEETGLTAQVVAQALDNGKIYTAPSDKSGKFFLTGLSPGDYRLYAWIGHDNIEYRNSHVLKANEGNSVTVSVAAHDAAYVGNLTTFEVKAKVSD